MEGNEKETTETTPKLGKRQRSILASCLVYEITRGSAFPWLAYKHGWSKSLAASSSRAVRVLECRGLLSLRKQGRYVIEASLTPDGRALALNLFPDLIEDSEIK